MNILADECIAGEIIDRLRADGNTVETADLSTSDDVILARANSTGQVLLTADKDFGELVYRLGRAHAGSCC